MNMKKLAFEPEAFEQLGEWGKEDKKILELIKDIQRELIYLLLIKTNDYSQLPHFLTLEQ